jgi:hypothetical protein
VDIGYNEMMNFKYWVKQDSNWLIQLEWLGK